MSELVRVRGLEVAYPVRSGLFRLRQRQVTAVAGVDLSVRSGQTVAVVGESGSGKTTLARAIGGLVPIRDGGVTFAGRDLRMLSPAGWREVRAGMSFVFQDPVASLSPRKSVATLLGEPFRIHRPEADPFAEAERLMDLVGLDRRLIRSYPHELSGGQARRVGLGRAIALSPSLVIADEPTAGLDLSVQGEILNLLMDLQNRLGLSYLIISHNLAVVRHISDRMAVMYLGQVVEEGPTAELFAAPSHPYTGGLIGASRVGGGTARIELTGEPGSLRSTSAGCRFQGRCPFVQDRCRSDAPALVATSDDRRVRCHFPLAAAAGALRPAAGSPR